MNEKLWKGRTLTITFSVPKASYDTKLDHIVQHTKLSKQDASLPKVLRDEKKKNDDLKKAKEDEKEKLKAEKEKLDKIRQKKKEKKLAK